MRHFVPGIRSDSPKPRERKKTGPTKKEREAALVNFWTAVHPRLDGKSPMEFLLKRISRTKLHQSPEEFTKKEYGTNRITSNGPKGEIL
ncbi:hypothetical protein ACTXT7_002841 [Hymenolepis weldensis]